MCDEKDIRRGQGIEGKFAVIEGLETDVWSCDICSTETGIPIGNKYYQNIVSHRQRQYLDTHQGQQDYVDKTGIVNNTRGNDISFHYHVYQSNASSSAYCSSPPPVSSSSLSLSCCHQGVQKVSRPIKPHLA